MGLLRRARDGIAGIGRTAADSPAMRGGAANGTEAPVEDGGHPPTDRPRVSVAAASLDISRRELTSGRRSIESGCERAHRPRAPPGPVRRSPLAARLSVRPDGFTVPATVSSPMEEQMRLSLKRNLVGLLALAGASLGLTASVAFADCYLVWVCIGGYCAWILVCI